MGQRLTEKSRRRRRTHKTNTKTVVWYHIRVGRWLKMFTQNTLYFMKFIKVHFKLNSGAQLSRILFQHFVTALCLSFALCKFVGGLFKPGIWVNFNYSLRQPGILFSDMCIISLFNRYLYKRRRKKLIIPKRILAKCRLHQQFICTIPCHGYLYDDFVFVKMLYFKLI